MNAGGMFAAELGRLAGVTVPVVPMAHEYLITRPSGLPLDMPTMRDPSLLVYFRPESGGLIMGGYERDPAPWSLDGIPVDFNGKLLEEDWPRFEPLLENAIRRVPTLEEMEVVRLINGPEAFTPDNEFILGPTDVARVLGCRRVLRAWPGGRRRDGQARRRVDRRGHAEPRRLGDGLPALRRRLPQPRVHARARDRGLLDLLRRQVPGPRAAGGPAAPPLLGVSPPPGTRRRLRREVGLGARELVRAERGGRRRVAAAARLGREALVGRCRRRASGLPRASRALRRVVVRQDRALRGRRGGSARPALRQPRHPRRRGDHVHPDAQPARRDRVRLHGDATRRGPLPDRHRHRLRAARLRLDPLACTRRRLGAGRGRDVEVRLPRALGAAGARDPAAARG